MKGNEDWIKEGKKTITRTKLILGNLVGNVRSAQFEIFEQNFKPNKKSRVADIGVSSEEDIGGTNQFEKLYKYPKKLTLATIENLQKLKKLYPTSKVIRISPGNKLPFPDKHFNIVVSWATLEHVGSYSDQEFFLNELIRIAEKVFVTTPYRGCVYEPHSGLPFLQWLPLGVFRWVCRNTGRKFWACVDNLNPLYVGDIKKMKLLKKPKIIIFKMFGFLPSHLLILVNR